MRELNHHQMRTLLERLSDEELAAIERAISILDAAARPDGRAAHRGQPEGVPS